MTKAQNKLSKLRATMAAQNVDICALGPGAHMQWLLGFVPFPDERPCILFVTQDSAVFLMPSLNAPGTREETDLPFYRWVDDVGPENALNLALADLNLPVHCRIALDETMRADFALLVLGALPQASHCFSETTVGALRMCKDDDEYTLLKENALICDEAMRAAFAGIKVGMSELDVAQIIRAQFSKQGAQPMFNIVGAGPNGAFCHHETGNRLIQDGDAIVIDIGGQKDNYFSDMTRMTIIGDGPQDYHDVHAVVDNAVRAACKAAKPGVIARDVDRAARLVIEKSGYGEYFVHRTGHGLGIEVHEPPYITSTSDCVLQEGMVFSIEPGIYLPGRFGIRLEEIVILRSDGVEILSELPRTVNRV